MPEPKLIQTYAMFLREAAGVADRTNKPSLSLSTHGIGTVTSAEYRTEDEEEVFDKPVDGRWVDYEVYPQRDRELFTLELSELSELFWKLLRRTNPTLSGGAATFELGAVPKAKGWLAVVAQDDNGDEIETVYRYCALKISSHTFPKTGLVTARIEGRKLYAGALNSGAWSNIA